ncbi:hypothetical protein DM992_10585 [Burkholderia sp. JP2-270]|nr:hypothetical protein DM992_10585 [Burkholderia sp. JP2-270]
MAIAFGVRVSNFDFEISVDPAFDRSGGKAALVKFSAPVVELNVYVSIGDIGKVIDFGRGGCDYVLAGSRRIIRSTGKERKVMCIYLLGAIKMCGMSRSLPIAT